MTIASDKNQKIKETLKKTKEKRKTQTPKVYQLKISYSNLSKQQKLWLERVFLEAKWLYFSSSVINLLKFLNFVLS